MLVLCSGSMGIVLGYVQMLKSFFFGSLSNILCRFYPDLLWLLAGFFRRLGKDLRRTMVVLGILVLLCRLVDLPNGLDHESLEVLHQIYSILVL